MHEPNAFSRSF